MKFLARSLKQMFLFRHKLVVTKMRIKSKQKNKENKEEMKYKLISTEKFKLRLRSKPVLII